jgi:DUF1365 family protein
LKRLGSDGKSVRSFRDIKNIHFKHDADDEAKYSVKEVESHIKNYVEVGQRHAMLTPNKSIVKERTKSERFGVAGNEIKSEKLIRVAHDDNFVTVPSKISEAAEQASILKEEKKVAKKESIKEKSVKKDPIVI